MKTYAYVKNGKIQNIIPPAVYDGESPDWVEGYPSRIGQEIPVELRFHPDLVSDMHEITDLVPMPEANWTFIDGVFAAPVPYQRSPEEILASNRLQQDQLKDAASLAMTPFLLSINLGNATDEETATAKAWQAYFRALQLVDLTTQSPDWPSSPAEVSV